MTQARKSEPDIGQFIITEETHKVAERAVRRLNAAMPDGMTYEEWDEEFSRLFEQRKWTACCRLSDRINQKEFKEALRDFCRVVHEMQWYVDDLRVPVEVEAQVWAAPPRKRKSLMEGIVTAFRGLMKLHPRFGRVLETATVRREEGQVFAEASRERRDELYRERVAWIAEKYQEVRGKYAPGVDGDKAARLEVAYAYAKVTGKKPMHDRSVRNILDAAAEVAARDHAETPG